MDKKGQNTVTDKELLAICNLSNLKMEFADLALARDRETGEIVRNHTISSLLERERQAILENKNTKEDRVFFKEFGENEETINEKKIIYKDIIDLKKEAGMVYECFETEEDFTKKWEILCAYDGYKLIAEYLDMQKESGYKGIFSSYCIKSGLECPKIYFD